MALSAEAQAAEKPADIVLVESWSQLSNVAPMSTDSEIADRFHTLIYERALSLLEQIANQNKIPATFINRELKNNISANLKMKIQTALGSESSKVTSEMMKVLQENMGPENVHRHLASHLGFDAPGTLVKPFPASPASARKIIQPNRPALDKQATLYSTPKAMRIDLPSSSVHKDHGGSGSSNGRIDQGEWIQLDLSLENKSKWRWYSTSAWFEIQNTCAWTQSTKEYLVPEVKSGDKVSVPFTFYVSEDCPSGEEIVVKVSIKDTHWTKGKSVEGEFRILPGSTGPGSLYDQLIDSDKPGFSNGDGNNPKMEAGKKMELNTGFTAGRGSIRARMKFDHSKAHSGFFKSAKFDFPELSPEVRRKEKEDKSIYYVRTGNYLPNDDFDIEATAPATFNKALAAEAKKWNWKSASDHKILVAVDVLAEYLSPDQTPGFQADPDLKKSPLSPEEIVDLIPGFLRLETKFPQNTNSAESSEVPAPVSSDSAPVHLSLDKKGLLAAIHGKPSESTSPLAVDQYTVPYRFRHYMVLDVHTETEAPAGSDEVCDDGLDNDLDQLVDCNDPNCFMNPVCLRKSMKRGTTVVDVGTHIPDMGLHFRYSRGKNFRFHLNTNYLWRISELEDVDKDHQAQLGLGLSYALPEIVGFQVEPMLTLGMAYWSYGEMIASYSDFGVTVRYNLQPAAGLYVDMVTTLAHHERMNTMMMPLFRAGAQFRY